MKHQNRLSNLLLALLGISISIFIFIAQGPYDNYWQYLIPAVPLVFVVLCATCISLFNKLRRVRQTAELIKNNYDLMTSIRGESHMLVRINNNKGDIDFEREYSLELVKNVRITTTKQEHISSEVPIKSMPPNAEILDSTIPLQSLTAIKLIKDEEIISQRKHIHYSWCYRLGKPIENKGDRVDYRYKLTIPKSESKAFSKEGGLLFIECGALEIKINATLIAPAGYSIVVISYNAIDYDGKLREDIDIPQPILGTGNEILNWTPPYAHAIKFVCNYKCIQK